MTSPIFRHTITPRIAPILARLITLRLGRGSLIVTTLHHGLPAGEPITGRILAAARCLAPLNPRSVLRLELLDDCVPPLRFDLPVGHTPRWPLILDHGRLLFPSPQQQPVKRGDFIVHPWIDIRCVPVVASRSASREVQR